MIHQYVTHHKPPDLTDLASEQRRADLREVSDHFVDPRAPELAKEGVGECHRHSNPSKFDISIPSVHSVTRRGKATHARRPSALPKPVVQCQVFHQAFRAQLGFIVPSSSLLFHSSTAFRRRSKCSSNRLAMPLDWRVSSMAHRSSATSVLLYPRERRGCIQKNPGGRSRGQRRPVPTAHSNMRTELGHQRRLRQRYLDLLARRR